MSTSRGGNGAGIEFTASGVSIKEGKITTKTGSQQEWSTPGLTGVQTNMGAGSSQAILIATNVSGFVWSPKKEQWYSIDGFKQDGMQFPASVNTDQHLSFEQNSDYGSLHVGDPVTGGTRILTWEDFTFHVQMTAVFTDDYNTCNLKDPIVNITLPKPSFVDPDYFNV